MNAHLDPVSDKPVLVTGVTGLIGAAIAMQLWKAGYNDRGTTRDVGKALSQSHITPLQRAEDRLEPVERISSPRTFHLNAKKVRIELGISFRDLEEAIADTWRDLERWGHLGKPNKARPVTATEG